MADGERKSTLTGSGYHFLNMYQSCRWRWYTRFGRKLVPDRVSRYLLFGQAFHSAKEAFYRHEALSADEMANVGLSRLDGLRDQYEKLDHYTEDIAKMTVMVHEWWKTFAADEFGNYEILAVEEAMDFDLPGGFVLTVRPDVVVREVASKMIYAFETKTTSRSVSEMARSVACQQQVDAQLLGITKWLTAKGLSVQSLAGIIPDIVYTRQSVKRAERTAPIMRSVKELADSKLAFAGLFAEIGQKLEAVEAKSHPPEMLFDRNGAWCAQFGCEYEPICRSRWSSPPPSYHLEG